MAARAAVLRKEQGPAGDRAVADAGLVPDEEGVPQPYACRLKLKRPDETI